MNYSELEDHIMQIGRKVIDIDPSLRFNSPIGISEIEKILPHREPFFKVSSVNAVDRKNQTIETSYWVDKDDPVFAGHFPGEPVYPGVLQMEIMGQAGLCLAYFIKNNTDQILPDAIPVRGLFTRVWHTAFIAPVLPDTQLKIRVKVLEDDDILCVIGAQILNKDEKLITHSILQLYYA